MDYHGRFDGGRAARFIRGHQWYASPPYSSEPWLAYSVRTSELLPAATSSMRSGSRLRTANQPRPPHPLRDLRNTHSGRDTRVIKTEEDTENLHPLLPRREENTRAPHGSRPLRDVGNMRIGRDNHIVKNEDKPEVLHQVLVRHGDRHAPSSHPRKTQAPAPEPSSAPLVPAQAVPPTLLALRQCLQHMARPKPQCPSVTPSNSSGQGTRPSAMGSAPPHSHAGASRSTANEESSTPLNMASQSAAPSLHGRHSPPDTGSVVSPLRGASQKRARDADSDSEDLGGLQLQKRRRGLRTATNAARLRRKNNMLEEAMVRVILGLD